MKVTTDRSLFCHFKKTVSRLAFLSLVFIVAFTNFSCGSFFGGDEPEDSGSEQTDIEDDWVPKGVPELMPIPFIPDGSEPSDFSGAESQAAQPEPEKPRIIPTTKFCGFLFNEGAMPAQVEEILAAVEEELKAEQEGADPETLAAIRAAFPSLPADVGDDRPYFYFAQAHGEDAGDPLNPNPIDIEANVTLDASGHRIFTFALELNRNWTITTGLKKRASGTEGDPTYQTEKILLTDSFTCTTNAENPIKTHAFVLKPSVTEGGKGTIDLKIILDSANTHQINSITILNDDNPNETLPFGASVDASHSNEFNVYAANVNSGAYKARIILKDGAGYQKFCSVQTINVFDNMVTNKWEGVPLVTSGITEDTQKFQVTDNAITQVAKTLYYVGTTTLGAISVVNGVDKGTGSPAAPFASLQKAIDTIAANGNGTKDYTIFVNGEISSATGTTLGTSLNGKASSIRIQGKNSSRDILKKTGLVTGSVLKVETSVPVTIENLTITGGNNTGGNGGGINIIPAAASITLGSGTVVTGNTAQNGSGVYVGGTFTMKGTAKVSENNDVFLPDGKVIAVQSLSGTGTVAKITEEHWARYSTIVTGTGLTAAISDRFLLTASTDDGWIKDYSSGTAITLDSPIYVGSTDTITGNNSNSGTKSSPYASITRACQDITNAGKDYIICVQGTVSGAQTLPASGSTTFAARKIILTGYTGDAIEDSINANEAGSALTVNTTVPVEIKNLTITGGKNLSGDGGGINVSQGTVILGDGAKITGNIAGNGGGVYVAAGAKLCMYGKALIGDTANPNETAVYVSGDSSKYANCASASGGGVGKGGGIYSYGEVWLGYKQPADTEEAKEPLVSNATDGYYGVVRNVSTGIAGGIYSFGTLKIASGNVSYNQSGPTYDAGGIYVQTNDVTITGGSIKKNVSHRNGGAFYIYPGKQVNISGPVEITENSVIVASDSFAAQGGAIYNDGTLEITGSAVITKNSVTNSGTGGSNGGAIAISNTGIVHLNDCTIGGDSLQNEAGSKGGAIYNNGQLFMAGNAMIYPGSTKTNDVYLENNKVITVKGTLTNSTGAAHVATITPSQYKRGIRILAGATGTEPYSLTETDPALFGLCENDSDWTKALASNEVTITAPVYVVDAADTLNTRPAGFGLGNTAANGALGTKSKPFSTIADALTVFEGTGEAEIIIAGTVNGAQSISSMNPAQLTIKGYKPDGAAADYVSTAALSGGFTTPTANGSTLSVSATGKTFIIQDLAIQGGNTTTNGGGINLSGGTVKLAKGARVIGNKASANGGGVYVGSGASFFMYQTAWVGDSIPTVASNSVSNGYANLADSGAGIYNDGGIVGLGCTDYNAWADSWSGSTLSGGVGRNYAETSGGGIYHASGKLGVLTGTVSYNCSAANGGGVYTSSTTGVSILSGSSPSFIQNKAAKGGAIYIPADKAVTISGNATFKGNTATSEGGAVYNAGTFTMEAGTIGGAGNQNTADSAGGAVYNGGTFNFSGVAYVYPGSVTAEKKYNDVYLTENNYVNIPASYSTSGAQTSMSRMAISPYLYKRGTKILKVADSVTVDDTLKARFKLADDPENDWSKENKQETVSGVTHKYVVINSPVYVAGTGSDTGRVLCGAGKTAAEGALGTKSKPFSTIAEALSVFEDSTSAANITVDGEVMGAQTIGGTISADSITIKGYKAAGATSSTAKINAGGASGAGSALTVNASGKTVTIQDLTITGGNATNGGGINLAAGTVKLTDGVTVTGNLASAQGGGVYVDSTAKLLMYGTAWIGDSSENQATSDTLTPSGSDTGCANTATKGGGIYNDGGIVALGYDAYTDAASNSPKDFTGGVGRNYAGLFGGGIYGKFTISGGSVSYNKSYLQGGGLYIPQNVTDAKITGGSITSNSAQSDGGAAYINGNAKLSMSGNAEISNNSAGNNGGGIFTYTYGTFEMSGGSFASNTATGAGGAIYQGGDFIMSGSALITPGSEKSNDVYLPSNKSFTVASTTLNGGTTVAAITLDSFRRGRQILDVSTSITLSEAQLNTIKGKIALTEDGWNKENIIFSSVYAGVKINSPIYVASTAASDSTRKVCSPGVTSGAKGTSAKPYATIAAALGASDLAVAGNKITIDGTIGKQEIAPSASLSAVTIAGYKAGSDTTSSAKIDAGGTTGAGSALTVNKSGLTVTITDLTITGGNAENGGGINLAAGTVNLESGAKVSSNKATSGGSGAGVYVASGATLNIKDGSAIFSNSAYTGTITGAGVFNSGTVNMSGGSVYSNTAYNGGGIYNSGTLSMTGGTIGGSGTPNSATNAGGAIFQNGTFNVSSGAFVYSGSETSNDVYLPSNKKVTIDSAWSGSQASNKMTLTPSTWARGSQVLAGTKAANYYTYFNTSDSEWSVGYKESSWTLTDDLKTRIGADIYVAGSENRASGISAPSETASERIGTKLKPFNSIEEGVKACWNTTLPFTVKFSGTITGTAQTIPAGSTSTGGLASAITIEGVQGNSKDIINRSLLTATDSGTALTINTATPVTIKKIKITGGYNRNASGGGIRANVAGASLTLGEGALVTANNISSSTTTDSGAGVYIEGTSTSPATFIMESDATISANSSGAGKGGGVGLSYATLCMIGKALIGDKDATSAATSATGQHSNYAQGGGGVYVGTGSKLRLGYATPTATTGTSLDAAYGIRYNYVYNAGGGVLVAAGSSVEIASGSISCNGTVANAQYKNGGGIYLNETATLTMSGGTIAKNKAYDGGGVYLYGNTSSGSSIVMNGGTIGDSSSGVNSAATTTGNAYSNYAANEGGGIYASTKTTVTLNGGNISYNYSGEKGGGIYTKTDTTFKANAKYNGAGGSGGGIYSASGTLTMTTGTIYGNKSYVTSTDSNVQKYCGGGGVWFDGTFKMGGGTIQGNTAVWYGGGVGTRDGALYMYGSAVIGDSSKTAVPNASSTTSPTANRAKYGAGFAGTNSPDLYLGYSAGAWSGGADDTFSGTASSLTGGIYYNYASEHGGGIYYTGNIPLVIKTGNISYNKAAASAGKGGGIYTESKLQMSGGTITGNAASNGGAVYLNNCVYEASGSIYIPYDSSSSSVNKENVVAMNGTSSKITVTGSLTNTNLKVMTVEPRAWAIGTLVADKDASVASNTFKTAVGKIGIVKNGIYSKIEPIGSYSSHSDATKGVLGIDFSTVTQSDILNYMSGKTWSLASAEPYPSDVLNYFFLCDKTTPNSKYAILKVIHYNSMDEGYYYANSVLIGSTNQESSLTTVSYDSSVTAYTLYATWNPFNVTSPTDADYIAVFVFNNYVTMQLGTNYLGWYKVQ